MQEHPKKLDTARGKQFGCKDAMRRRSRGPAMIRGSLVVIEFPDMDALNAWYTSPEYRR
jgi:uncharacterized protein (DUF1330 family)